MSIKNRLQVWQSERLTWRKGLREVALIALVYGAYRLTCSSLGNSVLPAFANSWDIIEIERNLGIFVEQEIQAIFIDNTFLVKMANALYTFLYYPVLIIFAILAFLQCRDQYYIVRNVFFVSAGLAFLCFALYPVAPPRLCVGLGFVDTMSLYGVLDYSSPGLSNMTNQYAAMPSLHFGWTFLIGVATFYMAKAWWLKLIGIMLPISMSIAVVATGNHFILDIVAGGIVIALAYAIVLLFNRFKGHLSSVNLPISRHNSSN